MPFTPAQSELPTPLEDERARYAQLQQYVGLLEGDKNELENENMRLTQKLGSLQERLQAKEGKKLKRFLPYATLPRRYRVCTLL
jgi:FtsZ-binding cell division protein ZapB